MVKAQKTAEVVAKWMDGRLFDPIVGFVLPGLGDAAGILMGAYVVYLARQAGASRAVQARMLINLAIDGLVGAVPFIGDLFDLIFRAHTRNLALLKERPDGEPQPGDWGVLIGAVALVLLALAIPVAVAVALWKALFVLVRP